jgi:hypothetical protein
MKKLVYVMVLILILGWAVYAPAAVVFLKDGGTIRAQAISRDKGSVVVLVNPESVTSFAASEIDLKKTFPPRKKRIKPVTTAVTVPAPVPGAPSQVNTAAAVAQPPGKADKKRSLPGVPNKLQEREIPKGSEEGALRKQKREMAERIKE